MIQEYSMDGKQNLPTKIDVPYREPHDHSGIGGAQAEASLAPRNSGIATGSIFRLIERHGYMLSINLVRSDGVGLVGGATGLDPDKCAGDFPRVIADPKCQLWSSSRNGADNRTTSCIPRTKFLSYGASRSSLQRGEDRLGVPQRSLQLGVPVGPGAARSADALGGGHFHLEAHAQPI
jgi:hypothetical protein